MASKLTSKIKSSTKENTVGVIAAVVILLTILLVGVIAIKISTSNRKNVVQTAEEEKPQALVENAESNSVTVYVERGVTADENHYSIAMTVSADNRTIRVLKGYQNVEDKSEGLPNNIEAYTTFLQALERYNFTESREDKSGFGWREACPTQKGYRFILKDQAFEEFNRWYTFCNGVRYGDYGGKVSSVYALFKNQFPNYNDVTGDIPL